MRKMLVAALILSGWCTISLADSLNVRTIGFCSTPDYARGLAISGNYAYVTAGTSGLQIINISNPASPALTGSFATSGTYYDVAVSGNYAYVADYWFGLRVLNISNPVSPSEVGYYDIPGNAMAVEVSGNYAYVAAEDSGLQIVNISDPAHPVPTGFFDTPDKAYDVALPASYTAYAYVADRTSGVRVINKSVPATPGEVGSYDTPGNAIGVAASGSYIFVADEASGLRILDLNGGLHEVGDYGIADGSVRKVAVSGNYAYVIDYFNFSMSNGGLQVVDISNPASPAQAGFYYVPATFMDVVMSGSYAYVSTGDGLRILQFPIPPVMELNFAQHDFGSVTVGDSLAWNGFYIRNIGSLPFSIQSLKFVTVNCWADPPADSTVAPGDSVQVTLWFKPDFIGSIVDTVTVYSGEAENSPLTAGLTGTGMPVIEVIDVPNGTVPVFEGAIEPAEWADAYCDTFRIFNKVKAFIPDSFWVKYNQDTLYLVLKTPSFIASGIAFHHLLFDTLMNRTETLENDDIRLGVFFEGKAVEFYGNNNWEQTPVSLWRSVFSDKTDLITEFVVPLNKIGITAGTTDSVGFSVFADGDDMFGSWPSYADSIQPLTWAILTSSAGWTGVAGQPGEQQKPKAFSFSNVYPNPVKVSAEFRYQLAHPSPVKLNVYNIAGQLVKSFDQRVQVPGSHSINWNVQSLPSGVYLYRLEAGSYKATKRMLVIK
ncbi:MAG: T9SS type A sorting domain-containing protein [bacterium]|nr:T9SS type A sorting domain-containing protein [bacterium]